MTGDSLYIAGIRGTIKRGSNLSFFWSNSGGGDNYAPFDKVGITASQKYDFCEKIIGYRSPSGGFPYCKTESDVRDIGRALDALFRDPTSTTDAFVSSTAAKEFNFTKADGGLLRGIIKVDPDGDWYWYNPKGSNGDCFYIATPRVNEELFQERLLGYRKGGSFPYCRSREDALRLCVALEAHNLDYIHKNKVIISPPEIPSSFKFTTSDGSLMEGSLNNDGNGWYWSNPRNINSECFDIILGTKEDFQQRILGYKGNGIFPYCRSKEDLYRLCLAIEQDRKLILAMKFGSAVTKINVMSGEVQQQDTLTYVVPSPVIVRVPKI